MARATCGWSANVRLGESLGRISFRTNRDDRAFAETWCRTAPESRFMVCGLLFTIATDWLWAVALFSCFSPYDVSPPFRAVQVA